MWVKVVMVGMGSFDGKAFMRVMFLIIIKL